EVRGADGGGVAVADHDQVLLVGLGELEPGGDGQRPAVGGPEVVPTPGGEGLPAHAADPGPEDHVVLLEPELVDGLEQPVLDHPDAAAMAGLGRDLARPQVFLRQLVHGQRTSVQMYGSSGTRPERATPPRAVTTSATVWSSALLPMKATFRLSGAARMTSRT